MTATLADEVRLMVSLPSPSDRVGIRQRAWITRERIAQELGVQPSTVGRWERGACDPHGALRLKYAQLLRHLEETVASAQQDAKAS